MGAKARLRSFIWGYFYDQPKLYALYNRLFYSKTEISVGVIGIALSIRPFREPTYFKLARGLAHNHALNSEMPKILAICTLLRPGTLFVDCGANVGLWSASIARLTALVPALEILAFEANPDTFGRLSRTAAAYPNMRCINVALSDREGEIAMSEGGSSLVFGVAGVWNRAGRSRLLPAMPLDFYLEGREDIILKIDVEGHEWPVLEGARTAIEEGRVRALLIDGFPTAAEAKIVAMLRGNRFAIFTADGLKPYIGGTMPILAILQDAR